MDTAKETMCKAEEHRSLREHWRKTRNEFFVISIDYYLKNGDWKRRGIIAIFLCVSLIVCLLFLLFLFSQNTVLHGKILSIFFNYLSFKILIFTEIYGLLLITILAVYLLVLMKKVSPAPGVVKKAKHWPVELDFKKAHPVVHLFFRVVTVPAVLLATVTLWGLERSKLRVIRKYSFEIMAVSFITLSIMMLATILALLTIFKHVGSENLKALMYIVVVLAILIVRKVDSLFLNKAFTEEDAHRAQEELTLLGYYIMLLLTLVLRIIPYPSDSTEAMLAEVLFNANATIVLIGTVKGRREELRN